MATIDVPMITEFFLEQLRCGGLWSWRREWELEQSALMRRLSPQLGKAVTNVNREVS